MKSLISKILSKFSEIVFKDFLQNIKKREHLLKLQIDKSICLKTRYKRAQNIPVKVVFVCHEPAFWSMFRSVYELMKSDPQFETVIIAMPKPYTNPISEKANFRIKNIIDFFNDNSIEFIKGYDVETGNWLDPLELAADYIFFQTPYNIYGPEWSIDMVSSFSRVCYIPYGTLMIKGRVAKIVHDEHFFKHVHLFFMQSDFKKKMFLDEFKDRDWCKESRVIVSGHPKLSFLLENKDCSGKVWRRKNDKSVKKVLWTPRWRQVEGTCSFYDYREYFFNFCIEHKEVDFVFRPHPRFFHDSVVTGDMSIKDLNKLKSDYDNSENMRIDLTGSYEDTLMTSDMLVSDITSIMFEYMATGKPIIYTHKKDIFNDFGKRLSEGFYWVRNERELNITVNMLLSGEDPMRDIRNKLRSELVYFPKNGPASIIKQSIIDDWNQCMVIVRSK